MARGKNVKRKQPRKPIRKYQRKQRAKSRMPFVEQKHKDEVTALAPMSLLDDVDGGGQVFIPHPFTFATQGDGQDQINGRWIYSKWITTQMTLSYDRMVDYNFPYNIRCRYGWVKLNMNPSETQGGLVGPIALNDLDLHVRDILKNNFDDSTLLPQKARDVLTLGDFMIKNNPRILEDSTSGDITTFRNDKHLKFKWSPQRKIQYQKCITSAGTEFLQCNQKNWIPFVSFKHVPGGSEDGPRTEELPQFKTGTRHYFTDS
jgi:hypothetical protein